MAKQRRATRSAKVAKQKKARARKAGARVRTLAAASPPRAAVDTSRGVVLRLPTRDVTLKTDDREVNFPRAAMQWTYVVRSRQRWSTATDSAERQARAASEMLASLGVDPLTQAEIARAGMVEVAIPWHGDEAAGWAERIFPWEYLLAGATHSLRQGQPLSVIRHLACRDTITPRANVAKVIFVTSSPGSLKDHYDFDSERGLIRRSLKLAPAWRDDANWKDLQNPTAQELGRAIAVFRPDIVHLAGVDTHLAENLLAPKDRKVLWQATDREGDEDKDNESFESAGRREIRDGYVLADRQGLRAAGAEELSTLLASEHKPRLVCMNFGNSAARLASLTVAQGAEAAIGIQDSFDDALSELFFSVLYSNLSPAAWDLGLAFRVAWERVREERTHRQGTGMVLWSRTSLITRSQNDAARQQQRAARRTQTTEKPLEPATLRPGEVSELISVDVKPFSDINYSVLHNRRHLFEVFSIKCARPMRNVAVKVSLNVGTEAAVYERMMEFRPPVVDLKTLVHLPLTSALARTIQESILSSIFVDVSWGNHVLFRDTLAVRLVPADQWRDNDTDGRWLPSFVFPRDPTVARTVETAQRYVQVLRDDPTAGFDGYQSFDPSGSDPAEEIDLQVQAIWSAIVHEQRLGYINPPPTYSNELDSQRLRTPSAIARFRSGTCIDLALFFAACLELIDVYPVIFLLEGHAFPGYWRSDTYFDEFRQARPELVEPEAAMIKLNASGAVAQRDPWIIETENYREIVQCINTGKLVPLETVRLTENSGFWDAVEAGREQLSDKREFHSMVDIALAREKQVTPLPLLGQQPGTPSPRRSALISTRLWPTSNCPMNSRPRNAPTPVRSGGDARFSHATIVASRRSP